MKFGKVLKNASEEMPQMNDLFLRYKELKKKLKAIPRDPNTTNNRHNGSDSDDAAAQQPAPQQHHPHTSTDHHHSSQHLAQEELEFIRTLNEDLDRFNQYFIDKEEDAVIQLQALSEQLQAAKDPQQLRALKQAFVDFHGEMVLLLHWSVLNYAAVVKILKKHDKRTGVLLRAPFLANVLQQPFASTSVMSRLVKMAEEKVMLLVGGGQGQGTSCITTAAAATGSTAADTAAAGAEDAHAGVMLRRTKTALETWHTMQKTAITPSTVLPPSSSNAMQQLAQGCQQQHSEPEHCNCTEQQQQRRALQRQGSLRAQQQQLLELQQQIASMDSDEEHAQEEEEQQQQQQQQHKRRAQEEQQSEDGEAAAQRPLKLLKQHSSTERH